MKALLLVIAALSLNASATCVEGNRSLFQEPGVNDHNVNVWRTCVNGSYYPKSSTVGKGCTEGATLIDYVSNGINDRQKMVVRTCVNGRYAPIAKATITQCKEGRVEFFTESTANDRSATVRKVCRAGKYVTQN